MARASRITPDELTLKEERFCQEYFACADGSASYLAAYDVKSENLDWVASEAYRMLKKPHIRRRIEDLRAKSEKIALYSADHAMAEAAEALELARQLKLPQAMTQAVTLRAKLAGHLVEKRENVSKSLREYTKEELDQALNDAAKEAGMEIKRIRDGSK